MFESLERRKEPTRTTGNTLSDMAEELADVMEVDEEKTEVLKKQQQKPNQSLRSLRNVHAEISHGMPGSSLGIEAL